MMMFCVARPVGAAPVGHCDAVQRIVTWWQKRAARSLSSDFLEKRSRLIRSQDRNPHPTDEQKWLLTKPSTVIRGYVEALTKEGTRLAGLEDPQATIMATTILEQSRRYEIDADSIRKIASVLAPLLEKQARYQVAIWTYRDAGQQVEADRLQRQLTDRLTYLPIQTSKLIHEHSTQETHYVELAGDLRGIWKAEMSYNPRPHNTVDSEVGAFLFDLYLGSDVVPTTVEKVWNGRRGSLQYWIRTKNLAEITRGPKQMADYLAKCRARLLWLHYLILDFDRTPQNIMLLDYYKCVAIDNGAAFMRHTFAKPKFMKTMSYEQMVFPISNKVYQKTSALIEADFKSVFDNRFSAIQVREIRKRARDLVDFVNLEIRTDSNAAFYD